MITFVMLSLQTGVQLRRAAYVCSDRCWRMLSRTQPRTNRNQQPAGAFRWCSAGLGGNFCSAAFEDPCVLVVGASGSVFGFIGLYVADLVLNFESILWPMVQLVTMLLSVGLTIALQVRRCA